MCVHIFLPKPAPNLITLQIDIAGANSPENRLPDICEHVASSLSATQPLTCQSSSESTASPMMSTVRAEGKPATGGTATTSITVQRSTSLRVHGPSTPRIDISRASSSSHHEDSRDSSPENVFDQVSVELRLGVLNAFKNEPSIGYHHSMCVRFTHCCRSCSTFDTPRRM